jgi:hypothetical protein
MWVEIDAWERDGSLPLDALLRTTTDAAFATAAARAGLSDPDPDHPFGMQALQVQACGHEVWREIAFRWYVCGLPVK